MVLYLCIFSGGAVQETDRYLKKAIRRNNTHTFWSDYLFKPVLGLNKSNRNRNRAIVCKTVKKRGKNLKLQSYPQQPRLSWPRYWKKNKTATQLLTISHPFQTHPHLCQGAVHGERQVDHAQGSSLKRQLGTSEGLMCHCGDLSMTWQLSYPHRHPAGAEEDERSEWHARI